MKDGLFVLHHVGGRNGFRSFPRVPAFESEFVSVMYEAAEDDNYRILKRGREFGNETILVNACVGRSNIEVLFNCNRDPYTSSFLSLNPNYSNFYMTDDSKFDYVLGESAFSLKQETMLTQSLDDLAASLDLPQCDFLSLDTQGSELDILQGAVDTLSNCVGLQIEVAFAEIYKGQPLFSEVDKFLRSQGFDFIRFKQFQEYAPLVNGVEIRGEKMQVFADAIYFRSPDNLSKDQYYPLLFTALCFGQTEFAISIIKGNFDPLTRSSDKNWMEFCDKFLELSNQITNKRQSYLDAFSIRQSSETRKQTGSPTTNFKNKLALNNIFNYLPKPVRSIISNVLSNYRSWRAQRSMLKQPYSKIEMLFVEVGLDSVAKRIKQSRCS